MSMVVAVLEDNQERTEAMAACLADRFHQFEHRFFEDANDLIAFVRENQSRVILLSLDHDLELVPDANGKFKDLGDGRQVADFVATLKPQFPIVLHSTNTTAVQGMHMVLQEAGWETIRVIPSDDVAWIGSAWLRAVRNAIVKNASWKSTHVA